MAPIVASLLANGLSLLGNAVMTKGKEVIAGDLPVVFINGRVKNNPTADEVVAEFKVAGKTPAKVATKR